MKRRRIVLIHAFMLLTIVSLLVGASNTFIDDLVHLRSSAWETLRIFRLPRTVAIILTATGLSISGLIMQSISRNKFISPSTAGTTDAALLGILLGYLLLGSQTNSIKLTFAFIFALASSLLFMVILNKINFKNIIYVPLIGMMYGSVVSALTIFIAQRYNAIQFIGAISVRGFSAIMEGQFEMLYIILFPLVIAIIYATKFSIVSLGEDFAENLGVKHRSVILIGLIIIAVTSATTFVMVGLIPFVGLIIPNIMSYYYGDHLKKSIIDIALMGSSFVLFTDTISRVLIYPYEITISFTMGIVGAAIFLVMIFRRMKHAK